MAIQAKETIPKFSKKQSNSRGRPVARLNVCIIPMKIIK